MELLQQFIEMIQKFIRMIRDLVAKIRDINDGKGETEEPAPEESDATV